MGERARWELGFLAKDRTGIQGEFVDLLGAAKGFAQAKQNELAMEREESNGERLKRHRFGFGWDFSYLPSMPLC